MKQKTEERGAERVLSVRESTYMHKSGDTEGEVPMSGAEIVLNAPPKSLSSSSY